nr:phosphatidate cytidylyltransferase [Nitrospira sp.]
MNLLHDAHARWFFEGLVTFLLVASLIGWILSRKVASENAQAVVRNLNSRIRAWWVMVAFFAAAVASGRLGSTLLFAAMSFLALREFVTLAPTRRGDHRVLLWLFFIIL